MNISGFNSISMNAATISKLFAPISADGTNGSNAGTVIPSVSSASSGANVTSAAIAAIQALVKGGTSVATSANASAGAQTGQSLPDWYTATGTTTFTPLNSTKPVTMPTDEYLWYKDGMPQTLDDIKDQFYKTNNVASLNTLVGEAEARGNQADVAFYTSLSNAVKSGTVQFSLIDSSVSCQQTGSVIRDSVGGHIIGNSLGANIDWLAVNKTYNVANGDKNYEIGANPFINGYIISWSKT